MVFSRPSLEVCEYAISKNIAGLRDVRERVSDVAYALRREGGLAIEPLISLTVRNASSRVGAGEIRAESGFSFA